MGILGAVIGGASGAAVVNILINGIDNFSKTFARAGVGMKALGLGMAAVGVAGIAASVLLIRKASKLEDAFRGVDVILGKAGAAEERFGEEVRRLSSELPIQGGRIAVLSGLYEVISAGITDTADATALLDTATQQAVAGNIDMSTSVKALTSIMRGYGMEFSQASVVSSKLFRTVDLGQITFEEISTTIGRLIPFADSLGISLNELLAGMTTLSGVTGDANEVSTQFRSIMGAIVKPTQDMMDVLTALGFATGEAAIEELGFLETLKAINTAADENNLNVGKILGRKEALTAFYALVGKSADTYADNLDKVGAATDDLQGKLGIATDTIASDWTLAVNNINIALEDMGGTLSENAAPAVTGFASIMQSLTTFMNTEFGGSLSATSILFGAIASVVALVVGVLALLGTAFGVIVLVVTSAVVIIVGFIMTIMDIIKNWDITVEFFTVRWRRFWGWIKDAAGVGTAYVIDKFNIMADVVKAVANAIIDSINLITRAISVIPGISIPLVPKFRSAFEATPSLGLPGIGTIASVKEKDRTTINIENIFGLDSEDVSKSLSDELFGKTSL